MRVAVRWMERIGRVAMRSGIDSCRREKARDENWKTDMGRLLANDLDFINIGSIIDQLRKSCFRVVIEP